MKFSRWCLLSALLLTGCAMLSQFTFDGAGHFANLVSCRSGVYTYNDNVSTYDFDSVIMMHVIITDHSQKPKEFGSQMLMVLLPEEYFNSTPELRETLYKRGDFARYYQQRIYGDWIPSENGNTMESYAIFGVKSKVKDIIMSYLRLQVFAQSTWLDVPISRRITIIPGSINYLGTLYVDVVATGESSGKTLKPAYFQYDTAVVEGDAYKAGFRLIYDETNFKKDLKTLTTHLPNLGNKYGNTFKVLQ
ncbi:hypothetical protein JW979_02030 [bacterium]|nr:hypothetical protein [candidate division CSSED10-310 bacterium]